MYEHEHRLQKINSGFNHYRVDHFGGGNADGYSDDHESINYELDGDNSDNDYDSAGYHNDADEFDSRISASQLYRWIVPEFEILNLVPKRNNQTRSEWRMVGNVTGEQATVNTILYIGADQVPDYIVYDGQDNGPSRPDNTGPDSDSRPLMYMTNSGKHRFRVVTNIAPPFVIESTKLNNNTCLTGEICLKVCMFG